MIRHDPVLPATIDRTTTTGTDLSVCPTSGLEHFDNIGNM